MSGSDAYTRLRGALETERQLLSEFSKLPPEELQQVFAASQALAQKIKLDAEKIKEEQLTKRKEIELKLRLKKEEEETKRQQARNEAAKEELKLRGEERRKFEEKKTDEEKKRVDYRLKRELEMQEEFTKKKLEAKRQFEQLEEEQKQREEAQLAIKRELEEKQKKEDLERQMKLLTHKLEEEAKLEIKLADFRHQQLVREHETFKKDRLERELALERVKQDGEKNREMIKWNTLSNFFTGDEGKKRMFNIFGLVAGSIAVLYAFKVSAPIAGQWLHNYFFKPTLVSKSVKYNWVTALKEKIRGQKPLEVILPPVLQQRMQRIVDGTVNTSKRGGFFGHIMLYGKPGTGKSMFAEKLARESKMDFALMSGPSFDQFKAPQAIVEIKNLFQWAQNSPRGLLLFIDECDSFLEDRSTLSPERVRVLNEFINQTGTESKKFMLCFETNRPEVLDPAVQSRITQSVEFIPPGKDQLRDMLKQYVNRYIVREHSKKHWFSRSLHIDVSELMDEKTMEEVVDKLSQAHFVGRDVTNFVISLTQAAYADPDFKISVATVNKVLQEQIEKKEMEKKYLASREQRLKERRLRNKLLE